MWKLVLLLTTLHVAVRSCPSGLTLVSAGECRGNIGRINTTWDNGLTDVTSKCNDIQAQPIIIHNDEQQTYWKGQADDETATILGLACSSSSKKWVWSDGTKLDYKPSGRDFQLDELRCEKSGIWYIKPNGHWTYSTGSDSITANIFCTAHLPPMPVPSDECEGFENDSDDAMCYEIASIAKPFQDAQILCKNAGSSVAAVHSQEENSFLRRLAVSRGGINGLYLGATPSGKGTDFSWIDGSDWDYTNFYPGFPMSGLGDCLVMDTQSTSGEWVNVDCNTPASVACARPQNSYRPPACPSEPPKEGDLIVSPGFPFNASVSCDYMLIVEAGKRVEVEIIVLEANSCCDHLTLYDNYFGGKLMADLTGEVSSKTYTTDSSNIVKVSWAPNGGVNVRGMMMTFRSV